MNRILFIKLNFPEGITPNDLTLRYILTDTIEERGIGKILHEGTGENYIEICIKPEADPSFEKEILEILESLQLRSRAKLIYSDNDLHD